MFNEGAEARFAFLKFARARVHLRDDACGVAGGLQEQCAEQRGQFKGL